MKKPHILLLQPLGKDPSPLDQAVGAILAATRGSVRGRIVLERAFFRRGDLKSLHRAVNRWAGKIHGVVGATSVPESTYLGELCERLGLLCFVSNNNPAVWNRRKFVFHIGVPTGSTSRAVTSYLLRKVRAKRIYLLHDTTVFQKRVARAVGSLLEKGGAEVRSKFGGQKNWLDDVRRWKPEAVYLIYSSPTLALPLVRKLRRALPKTPQLLGRSLLRESFLSAFGPAAGGLILLDLFRRGAPRTKEERLFMKVLHKERVTIPTANHGFGWDTMNLCARALAAAKGDASAAITRLESAGLIPGATGLFRFSKNNHNGRARFNPTTFSRLRKGRIEEAIRKDKAYEAAKRRALTRLQKRVNLRWTPPKTRDELHER